MIVSGVNPRRNLVEIIELKGHPWFVGTQAHPEFQSKPNRAHPLVRGVHRGRASNREKAAAREES